MTKQQEATSVATAPSRTKASAEASPDGDAKSKPPQQDGMRETIESIVVALILAFLFRTFEAEAFVIPTGSMAPTLLGRHKDVDCKQCGLHFTIGASDEVDDFEHYFPERRIERTLCPNCRFENDVRELPVFKGDRILVNKFPYEFGEPDRFDVAVFKYPEDPKMNYIKRLVGLPGEIIRISRGDLYVRTDDEMGTWEIKRKEDPNKQRMLQQLVFDDNYPARALVENGWPERWAAMANTGNDETGIAGWSEVNDGWHRVEGRRAYAVKQSDEAEADYNWLRYRHYVPSQRDWRSAVEGGGIADEPRPQLITDFCGYNAFDSGMRMADEYGTFWVGDLTVSCTVNIEQAAEDSELVLELNEGGRRYRCRFDVTTGRATLSFVDLYYSEDDERTVSVAEETALNGPGTYDLSFANVDDRLCVWIDGELVEFEAETTYHPAEPLGPQDEDLLPAGVAAKGLDIEVSNLLVERDIYYRANYVRSRNDYNRDPVDKEEFQGIVPVERLSELLDNPRAWYELYQKYAEPATFDRLGEDEYFMLGDNSPRSKDSRLWSNSRRARNRHAVPGSALVGKAFFIYWPHGVPFLNEGEGFPVLYHRISKHSTRPQADDRYARFRLPFYPNVGRMHRIR